MSAIDAVSCPRIGGIAATALIALGCGGGSAAPPSPPARPRTLATPQLFAPGRVSTAAPEFATSFARDGRTVYFNLASDDRSVLKIMQATRQGDGWSEARPVAFSDGTYRDVDPFVAPDGQRLYFSSTRPVSGTAPKDDFGTWYVERAGDGWSAPIHAGAALDGPASEVFVSLTAGGTVYFSSDVAGEGRRDIYRAPLVDGERGQPERIALRMEGAGADLRVGNPCIDPQDRFLLFVADAAPDNADLFISWRENGRFGPARNLGPRINSAQADFAPALGPDGTTLFFTSERPGVVPAGQVAGRPPGDIYQVDLAPLLAERRAEPAP